jgi:hypothetical protein
MKAKIESTTAVVEMKDCNGRPFTARVWSGVTEGGVEFTAYIAVIQVLRSEDCTEFDRDLREHSQSSAVTQRAIYLRFVI